MNSKDIPIESDGEDITLFEEDEQHEKKPTNKKEGTIKPIQPKIIPEVKKRLNRLKATLEYAEGHGLAQGTFKEAKKPKRYS